MLTDNPDDEINIHVQLGYRYMNNQQYEMAFNTFESLLKKHPNYTAAWYWIGTIAATAGKNIDRGLECLKKYT